MSHKPTILIILDGWGVAAPSRGNAITLANTPNFDHYVASYPVMTLQASGEATGLPWSEVGNSEVGHANIGAGRIVYQDLTRINKSISDNSFYENESFLGAIKHCKDNNSALHLISMFSSGGVHSYDQHLYALLELAHKHDLKKVNFHIILDGRDVPYNSGKDYVFRLQQRINELNTGTIVTLTGRFWAMDRDNHWDRIENAYNTIALGKSTKHFESAEKAIEDQYGQKIYDEEFIPSVIGDYDGIKANDAIIMTNFRADRARQIAQSLSLPNFNKFQRDYIKNLYICTFTNYEKDLPVKVAFSQQQIVDSLPAVISKNGMTQLHIAETEKYAHITYFLNGGDETFLPGEDRTLIPSPPVTSYDQKPEMSCREITNQVIKEINRDHYDFIAINFANADMVGHTGNLEATIKAVEALDWSLGQIVSLALHKNGKVLITADHGNAEDMINLQTGIINKEHSNNPVPLIIISHETEGQSATPVDISNKDLSILEPSGILPDIAPTILSLLKIDKPSLMTGTSLI